MDNILDNILYNLEIERRKLYNFIENKASYEDILRQSHVVDVYVAKLLKATKK